MAGQQVLHLAGTTAGAVTGCWQQRMMAPGYVFTPTAPTSRHMVLVMQLMAQPPAPSGVYKAACLHAARGAGGHCVALAATKARIADAACPFACPSPHPSFHAGQPPGVWSAGVA